MSIVLGANQYGKAETRVVRIYRDPPEHEIRDLNVSTSLRGDFAAAHLHGDQSAVLPTDTQKNTAYAYAKEHGGGDVEDYALALARHFVGRHRAGAGGPGGRGRVPLGADQRRTAPTPARVRPGRAGDPDGVGRSSRTRPAGCWPGCATWSC